MTAAVTSSFFLGSDSWFLNSGESPYGEYARTLSCCWSMACWAAAALGSVRAAREKFKNTAPPQKKLPGKRRKTFHEIIWMLKVCSCCNVCVSAKLWMRINMHEASLWCVLSSFSVSGSDSQAVSGCSPTGCCGAPKPRVLVPVLNPAAPNVPIVPSVVPSLFWLFPNRDVCPVPTAEHRTPVSIYLWGRLSLSLSLSLHFKS